MLPHPDVESLRDHGQNALEWVLQDFVQLGEGTVGQSASREQMEKLFREPPPEDPISFEQVLADVDEKVRPWAYRTNHPRFFAFVPSAPNYYSVLGELICSGLNLFSGVWVEAPSAAQIEILVLDWFKEWLGYPSQAKGILTGGGSEANLTALVVAREQIPLEDRPRAVCYVTEQRHWSIDRAGKLMGLLPEQIHPIPVDDQYRLSVDALVSEIKADREKGLRPWVVVANAGATNTGAVDALEELADLCERENMWLHVDGAYGWAAVLAEEGKRALSGIGRADSITLDPHKWLSQTFEAGCVLVREGQLLPQTFSMLPEYMQDVAPTEEEINFCDHGMSLSRRFRALKIWMSIRVLGMGWFRALAERGLQLAELAEIRLRSAGCFEMLSERHLSIVCFRFVPESFEIHTEEDQEYLDDLQLKIIEKLRATKRAFLSSTRLLGRVSLRLCFVNWRTTTEDLEETIDLLKNLGEEITTDEHR